MAEARRTFTPADKHEIVAYADNHGPKAAMVKYKINGWSQINRWRKDMGAHPVSMRKKKWTDDKIAQVLEYLKTHGHNEARQHFKISGAQIHMWRHGKKYLPRKPKGNGTLSLTNGLGQLPEKDALMWLERWRQAYFDRLKAETPSATSVLEALRGGK